MNEEDADLERAKALSLITIHQDEQRRRQLCSSQETVHNDPSNKQGGERLQSSNSMPDFAFSSNLVPQPEDRTPSPNPVSTGIATISRPRPQSNKSKTGDPRGSPQLTLPGPPKIPPRPDPALCTMPRKAHNIHSDKQIFNDQLTNVLSTSMPKIRPPEKANRDRPAEKGAGLSNTDILRDRSSSVPLPTSTNVNKQPVSTSAALAVPKTKNDTDLIMLSPPASSKKDPLDFDIFSLDPFRPSPVKASKDQLDSQGLPPRPHLPVRVSPKPPKKSVQVSKSAEPRLCDNPAYGFVWNAVPSVPPRPRTSSDGSQLRADKSDSGASLQLSLPPPDVSTDVSPSPSHRPLSHTSSSSSGHYTDITKFQQDSDLPQAAIQDVGDLMDFTDEDYLSLESFDPLYDFGNVQSAVNAGGKVDQNLHLFPKENSRDVSEATEDNDKVIEPTEDKEQAKESSQKPKLARDESFAGLQDPFSVSDLTSALEKKRLKHVQEQEKRQEKQKEEQEEKRKADEQEMTKKKEFNETISRKESVARRNSYIVKGQESSYEMLQPFDETADEEIVSFCQMVGRIKMMYCYDDEKTNQGVVFCAKVKHQLYSDLSVKVIVHFRFSADPVIFTCNLNTTVLHVIEHVLLSITEDLGSICADDYILKVFGLSEYLDNNSKLCEYEYIDECLKLDKDIKLVIDKYTDIERPFRRTAHDDHYAVFVPKPRDVDNDSIRVTKDKLNILMETYYKEVERLRDLAIKCGFENVHCKGVAQAVKAICAVLHKIETIDIFKSIRRLQSVVGEPVSKKALPVEEQLNDLHLALEEVTRSVKGLIEMYCRTFHTHFRFESATKVPREMREVIQLDENLLIHISTAHRLPLKTKHNYEEYKVVCGLYYGGNRLAPDVVTHACHRRSDGFQDTIVWDEWLIFDEVLLCNLPRESRLLFTLVGVKNVQQATNEGTHRVHSILGWVAMQLFDHAFELVKGSQLLGLWPGNPNALGTSFSNTDHPNSILLQVNMPDFDFDLSFPAVPEPVPSEAQDFKTLHPNDQEQLMDALDTDAVASMTCEEMDVIWEKRHFLYDLPEALPLVLRSCPCWAWSCLCQTYTMIQQWASLPPLHSMQLLLSQYPDTYVRNRAVERIRDIGADELIDFLPQLVQALKFESYHTSSLARMLLERSVSNVRFAHHLYWLLKEAADDFCYRKRYQLMFGALLSVVGESMRREFSKEEDAVKMLSAIADKVKAAKERENVLQRELTNMWDFLHHESVRLPLNPAMHVNGVDVKSCSFFTSFTVPLKLVLHNIDKRAEPLYIMFKVGDDLRQDMLTMQLVRVMDRLWLREGLDLKMITFRCQPTGNKRGMVEIVTESDTLRKIQVKHGHGVAGSFKDRPIHEWLQTQNPTELDYEKAVNNFSLSCAGYCVATYVLGICDRHNDNIMIKQSGHLFHIDFAKFLGDSQMFGTFKRDRTPFVLTSDMAYVINGGDKPSHRFQNFIDVCCRAFNVLRKHRRLLVNLFSLMTLSGIPGVTNDAACYVHKALLPDSTDAEATASFTRMINKCLESTFTQVNFFIHNLAQMKFSGHQEGALLSFIPKTYSIHTDGRISHVEVFGFQKRYNPEKYYIFIIKVLRAGQQVPSFVFRRYSEFQELHHKLVVTFPLIRLPHFSGKVLLGRTHVKTVAENRKSELDHFLKKLLQLAPEIAEHDLVYTFFHPMLRDEQDMDKTNLQKLKDPTSPPPLTRVIEGQIKLSLSYKNDTFTVMVMHVKDLAPSSSSEAPDPYVKLYLMPDPQKLTKRKTKIAKSTYHPTYNEMLLYRIPLDVLKTRTLQVTVWNYDQLKENEFMGAVHVPLSDVDFSQEIAGWFKFQTLHRMSIS